MKDLRGCTDSPDFFQPFGGQFLIFLVLNNQSGIFESAHLTGQGNEFHVQVVQAFKLAVFSNTNRNFERTSYAQALKEDNSLCAEVDEDQHLLSKNDTFTYVGSSLVVSLLFSL